MRNQPPKIINGAICKMTKVEGHPLRKEIEKDLIDRIPYTRLAKKYGVTPVQLSAYYNRKLKPELSKVLRSDMVENVDRILMRLEIVADRNTKLLDACDKWLSDPENEDEYNLDPRASELEIVYNVFSEGGKKIRQKDSLQRILNKINGEGNLDVVRVVAKVADPRELILKTSAEMREELKLVAQITGDLKNVGSEVNINILGSNLSNMFIDATKDSPEVQENLMKSLRRIVRDATPK